MHLQKLQFCMQSRSAGLLGGFLDYPSTDKVQRSQIFFSLGILLSLHATLAARTPFEFLCMRTSAFFLTKINSPMQILFDFGINLGDSTLKSRLLTRMFV